MSRRYSFRGEPRLVHRAFTLVEMSALALVVATLAAILLPAARTVHQQDRLAGCLSNLRAIGAASLAYAGADPNELFIPVPDFSVLPDGIGDFEWGGRAGRGSSSIPGDLTFSYWGTRNFRGPAHRPLNGMLYKHGIIDWNPINGTPQPGPGGINYLNDTNLDLDVYRCPADTGYAGGGFLYTATIRPPNHSQYVETPFRDEGRTAYDHYGTSYVAQTFYITGGTGGSLVRSQSVYLSPLSTVPNPGRTLTYKEVPGRYTWLWGDWSDPSCSWTGRPNLVEGNFATIPGWHSLIFSFNVAFTDGRAATVELKGCMRPPPNLGEPNYPQNVCGGSLSGYDCLRCVTIRGPGWQIDSLPAPAVPTPWYNIRSVEPARRDQQDVIRVFP